METWFAVLGTIAALVEAPDLESAELEALRVFARHRGRSVDWDGWAAIRIREATETDRAVFAAAKDGADISDLEVAQVSDEQISMFNQQEG